MTFKEALEKNKKMVKNLKAKNGKLEWTKENEKIMKKFLITCLEDAGFLILALLVSEFWKTEE